MRTLKAVAVMMVVLLTLSLAFAGYVFMTARVSVVDFRVHGLPTTEIPDQFAHIKAAVENRTFLGTLFTADPLGEAEDYALVTYTLRISNNCLAPIDMVEIQVLPSPDDVLQLGDQSVSSLQPRSQGTVSAAILTRKDAHTVRELIVTYYVWGVSFTIADVIAAEASS